jgi:hypothetical protein
MRHACLALALVACSQSADSAANACSADEPCTCSDGAAGVQVCAADGTLAACACGRAGTCAPVFSDEYCDGLDNDCNGVVDDREVCPDATVANATPFSGAVYLQGVLGQGSCGSDALQRFWPTPSPSYRSGFDCYAEWYHFRRSDNALYYTSVFSGIHQDSDTIDPLVPTPPCDTTVDPAAMPGTYFDFDASSTLYYQCNGEVRKGDGTLVAQNASLVAVLDDGRVIATRRSVGRTDFVVLDGSGNELSRLSPGAELGGELTAAVEATTVVGNLGYVAYRRRYPIQQSEVVVYRVDESSTWSRVRRAAVPGFGFAQLVLSDGTVLIREQDPNNRNEVTQRIMAFLPDGTSRIAWSEVDPGNVRSFIGFGLLTGPL